MPLDWRRPGPVGAMGTAPVDRLRDTLLVLTNLGADRARLTGIDWVDDAEFAANGLDAESTAELRRWAQSWADDITERLHELEVADGI
ncbi:hypothetical protein PS467_18170 [Streptomyces luomodiensis]|uniref:Uncharacterized protein n=1 Tax=Streptomyces luomodiensis TaxID=3026192 RepID=A0ABY9VB54_9ACTN|nr:hypothetical protein [Streptomyces sp. SCA4-21]WNF01867.1 hypothetical protein PS467_18170 [Streptomyces sp. SCA4-21]